MVGFSFNISVIKIKTINTISRKVVIHLYVLSVEYKTLHMPDITRSYELNEHFRNHQRNDQHNIVLYQSISIVFWKISVLPKYTYSSMYVARAFTVLFANTVPCVFCSGSLIVGMTTTNLFVVWTHGIYTCWTFLTGKRLGKRDHL